MRACVCVLEGVLVLQTFGGRLRDVSHEAVFGWAAMDPCNQTTASVPAYIMHFPMKFLVDRRAAIIQRLGTTNKCVPG